MPLPNVIAICGKKRCGKDTVANILCNLYGYENIKIAQGLKDMLKTLFQFSDEQLETDSKDHVDMRWGISPRSAMQFMGTEVMQFEIQKILPDIGRKFWIKRTLDIINQNPHKKYVISDLRFLHEFDELKKINAFIMCVDRSNNIEEDTHSSETEFKNIPYDVIIYNNSTFKHLQDTINTLNQTL